MNPLTSLQITDIGSRRSGRTSRSTRRPGQPTATVSSLDRRRGSTRAAGDAGPTGAGAPTVTPVASAPRPLRRWSVTELIARADGLPRLTA